MTGKRFADRWRDARGFSLIEMVVAIAILVIGILGVVPMLAFNIRANVGGKNYGFASYLAQEKMEQIRSWPLYDDFDALTRPGVTINNNLLFATNVIYNEQRTTKFTRTVELGHNGFENLGGGSGDCNGLKFQSGAGGFDEDLNLGGIPGSMNTGDVGEKCGGTFRGEDFKLVRVTVTWEDNNCNRYLNPLGCKHQIIRHMYVAGY
jgi:prepilin-type N-terminal cleavage/methylation domain-containing protein